VKAVVMARKRRAPKYAGALAQPIYLEDHYKFTGGLGQPNRELDIDAIRKRAAEKVRLLYKHYKIDPSDEQSLEKLARNLAFEHVPGLQLANRPKRGRKPKTGLYDELVRAVDDVKSRTGKSTKGTGKSTKGAFAELLKEPKWNTYTPQNLEARYWETRARQKELASKLASLQEDWEKGIVFGVDLAALFATAAPLGRPHEVTGRATKIGARAKKSRDENSARSKP
jgi:hypothetical protein